MTQPRVPRTPEQWIGLVASIVAPTTLLTALLYYFGYVATLAKFAYFGVDVDALGYASSDFVLRSAAALFVPVLVLVLVILAGYLGQRFARRVLVRHRGEPLLRRVGLAVGVVGLAVFGRGIAGVLDVELARREPATFTPLCLALGVLAIGYGAWSWQFGTDGDRSFRMTGAERVSAALIGAVVVFSLFWVTNTVAAAYGRGEAKRIAGDPATRPSIVLDTTERLYIPVGSATEQQLPAEPDQQFRYRYLGFRLLTVSSDGWLVLSENWKPGSGYVLVVPRGDQTRVRLAPG